MRALAKCRKSGIDAPVPLFMDAASRLIFMERITGITAREVINRDRSPWTGTVPMPALQRTEQYSDLAIGHMDQRQRSSWQRPSANWWHAFMIVASSMAI
jgi:hypothetical protein